MDFGAFASSSSTPVGESSLEVLAAAAAVGVFATAILAALGDEMRRTTGVEMRNCPMRKDVAVGVEVERAARAPRLSRGVQPCGAAKLARAWRSRLSRTGADAPYARMRATRNPVRARRGGVFAACAWRG